MVSRPRTSFTNTSTVIRVCFDANIFISAFLFSGKPAKIFDLAVERKIVAVTSPAIIAEIASVLERKFDWGERDIKKQLKVVSSVCQIITPKKRIHEIVYGPDNKILECAVEGKTDYIVSGDKKHLLSLGKFEGIGIVSADRFLKIIGSI